MCILQLPIPLPPFYPPLPFPLPSPPPLISPQMCCYLTSQIKLAEKLKQKEQVCEQLSVEKAVCELTLTEMTEQLREFAEQLHTKEASIMRLVRLDGRSLHMKLLYVPCDDMLPWQHVWVAVPSSVCGLCLISVISNVFHSPCPCPSHCLPLPSPALPNPFPSP